MDARALITGKWPNRALLFVTVTLFAYALFHRFMQGDTGYAASGFVMLMAALTCLSLSSMVRQSWAKWCTLGGALVLLALALRLLRMDQP